MGWNCGILVCLVVQRYAARWKISDYGSDVSYSEIVLFPMTNPESLQAELKEHAESPGRTAWVLMRERIKWYLSNIYTINGLAVRLSVQEPHNAGIHTLTPALLTLTQVFIVVLVISIFVRNNVLAVAYLPILGISLLLSDRSLMSAFLFLAVFLAAALVLQFVALFPFPPVLGTSNAVSH